MKKTAKAFNKNFQTKVFPTTRKTFAAGKDCANMENLKLNQTIWRMVKPTAIYTINEEPLDSKQNFICCYNLPYKNQDIKLKMEENI